MAAVRPADSLRQTVLVVTRFGAERPRRRLLASAVILAPVLISTSRLGRGPRPHDQVAQVVCLVAWAQPGLPPWVTPLPFPSAGRHRAGGQRGPGRRQRPQSPQHPGRHHCECPAPTPFCPHSPGEQGPPGTRGPGLGQEALPTVRGGELGAGLGVGCPSAGYAVDRVVCAPVPGSRGVNVTCESTSSPLQTLWPLPMRNLLLGLCADVEPSVVPEILGCILAGPGLEWTSFPVFEDFSLGQILRRLAGFRGCTSQAHIEAGPPGLREGRCCLTSPTSEAPPL